MLHRDTKSEKNAAYRLAQSRVAANLQFIKNKQKNPISAKSSKAKPNRMMYALVTCV